MMAEIDTPDAPPKDFDALRSAILERKSSLPKRLTQVAAYALDNPDEIAFRTAASIAGAANVQPSTLVRFAQQFGFTWGFRATMDPSLGTGTGLVFKVGIQRGLDVGYCEYRATH